ncbi:MAG TPA: branched-chain amino acid ABC transporter permease [Frankiaceae bacterium]|nr:branched-chain amino acid ABC transporter permease [Frankiaceae bacterium]
MSNVVPSGQPTGPYAPTPGRAQPASPVGRVVRQASDGWHEFAGRFDAQRVPLAGAGAALVVAGSFLPWAAFSGFPGKMTLSGYPGGVRAYCLALVVFAAFAFHRRAGGDAAGEVASLGMLVVTLYTVLAIAVEGGGLVNVAVGGWLCLVGSVLLLAAFGSQPRDEVVEPLPPGSVWLQLLAIVVVIGLMLMLVVEGLSIEASNQFVAFLVAIAFFLLAAARVGVTAWFQAASERQRMITIVAALLSAAVFPFTQAGSNYWLRVAASVGVFAAVVVGLNIVVGLAGLLDLGYVAFFGVGAYVGASLSGAEASNLDVHLPFLVVLVIGALVAAGFGIAIGAPTLRLRGDYLAIVTLAFGEIFRIAANNLDGTAGPKITNGPNGIPGVPNLELPGGFNFGDSHELFGIELAYFANYFWAELVLLVFVILVFVRLNNSRVGRAWVAIREDETAAAAMGVNTTRLKLLAFAIGAFLAGAAGTLNAHLTTQVSPDSYKFDESILLLAAVVLGGMGTIGGALLGSAAIVVIPEKLRFVEEKRILLFGVALILMMRFRPEGIVPNKRRQREFHDDTSGADATSAPPGSPVATA